MKSKNNSMILFNGDIIITIIIGLFSLMMLLLSVDYPKEARRFPQIVAGFTLILCIFQIAMFLIRSKQKKESEQKDERDSESSSNIPAKKWIGVFCITLAYYLVVVPIGFIISSILLLSVIPVYLGYRRYKIIISVAVITTLIAYYIFTGIFYVPLPKGLFIL